MSNSDKPKRPRLTKTQKRDRKVKQLKNFKLRFMLAVFLVGIVFLIFQTVQIYIAHADEFAQITMRQQVYGRRGHTDRVITPNRGSIVDRNGQAMAVSHTVYNIFMDVRLLAAAADTERVLPGGERTTELALTTDVLYQLFGIDPERIRTYTAINPETERPNRDTHFLILERGVDPLREAQLMNFGLLHVHSEEDTLRTYPAGATTASIVGFLSGDGSHWGMERMYDHFLTGTPGRLVRMFNEVGAVVTNQFPSTTGYTLVTTLDLGLQQSAHDIAMTFGSTYNAYNAQVIVMDPNTGEILAMAQYPSFNNNNPFNVNYINSARVQAELYDVTDYERTEALFSVWGNRAIAHSFEPGSIFKPIIHAAALEEGETYPGEQFFCPGFMIVAGQRINCWNVHGHGHLTLEQSMAISCNVVSMILGARLGRDRMYDYLRDFGVGQLTGIDIGGEASAFNVTISRHQFNPVEIAVASFGQGFNMTAMQSMVAFGAVINGGNVVVPYLLSQVTDGEHIVYENTPTIRRNVISQSTSDMWREAMVGTIEWDRGTARAAHVEGYLIGAKTGTAQWGNREADTFVRSTIAYLPAENPRYMVMVHLDRPTPDPGSAPMHRMLRYMLEEVITQRGIHPDGINDAMTSPLVVLDDYRGLNFVDATTRLAQKGLLAEHIGNGSVVYVQAPLPGEVVPRGTTVILHITSAEHAQSLVTIPNLVNMPPAQAMSVLLGLNLTYTLFPARPDIDVETILADTTGTAMVVSQGTQAGSSISEGSAIVLLLDVEQPPQEAPADENGDIATTH